MFSMLNKIKGLMNVGIKNIYLSTLPTSKYKSFLSKEYKHKTGEVLNIETPKKYTEKMQYAKLYLNSPLKTELSDKYLVRKWVSDRIGSEYLIPLIGVWNNFSEINFNKFPNQFVLKLNNGSGTNIIVKDKTDFNYSKSKMRFKRWMNINYALAGDIQPHYGDIKNKIIAEEYIKDSTGQLNDYKFFCFDGKVYYCWVFVQDDNERYGNVYDLDWNLQDWRFRDRKNTPYNVPKPPNFNHMVELATLLSNGFSHVRVDLYNVDGVIYFGEMTFTSSGGFNPIIPE